MEIPEHERGSALPACTEFADQGLHKAAEETGSVHTAPMVIHPSLIVLEILLEGELCLKQCLKRLLFASPTGLGARILT